MGTLLGLTHYKEDYGPQYTESPSSTLFSPSEENLKSRERTQEDSVEEEP